jgi:peptidoglycan/LPS O-acetylase OafA/YrhL
MVACVEEQFYLLWPVLLIALSRSHKLLWGLVGIIIGVCAWRSLLYVGFSVPDYYVYNAFDTRFDSLAIGCLLAVLTTNPVFVEVCRRLGRRAVYPIPIILLIFVSRDLIGPTWHFTVGYTVDSLLIAILIVQLLQLSSEPGWRWLDSRLSVWIGALSYPLYLWHIWGLSMADNLTGSEARGPNFIVGVALSFLFASVSYYGLEKHFLRLKSRLANRDRQALPRTRAATVRISED